MVLLLQKKGPELTFTELDPVTGSATGLRKTERFHGAAVSGLLVDAQEQFVYLLQSAPQMAFYKFQVRGGTLLPVSNATLRSASSDKILNVRARSCS